ncbi:hypothetical protein EXIGLDRAFT_833735 [Exidia glandulosa HHB12029]|uniref:Uncharacterized protein n=1 Tax=Exidia glandulosa HHB12029 TaxID=1314781 RepID=A0A166AYB6_EXIGL|nr:hypothetical protein EXIGLDRAFT_833735 [Exidia glandulosa HHB12029]
MMREVAQELLRYDRMSTGIYEYPLAAATHIALRKTGDFLASEQGSSISRVIFTVFLQIDVNSYKKILPLYFPPAPPPSERSGDAAQPQPPAAVESKEKEKTSSAT